MSKPNRYLIVARHAERVRGYGFGGEAGISAEGFNQAAALAEAICLRHPEVANMQLLTSPAARCKQTLAPLAARLNLQVQTEPALAEHQPLESPEEFQQRVSGFLKQWQNGDAPVTLVCSHNDWIAGFFVAAIGREQWFSPAQWIELSYDGVQMVQAS